MKCPECQFENPGDTHFCGNCGTRIKPLGDIPPSHTKTAQIPVKVIARGTTIADRYEVMEELGRGGMGNVYRVVDKKINEEIALKLLHPVVATDKKTIERFKNELKLARKITHKNVCRMYDLNEEKGTPYITMEYIPGEDLKSVIMMTGQLNVERAISIAKQICEGLSEAHHLGVVHRDLKSRNIMIDKEGNARIMDFGIARSLEAKGITGDGIMVGTPEYMSPEQVKGEETDQRSDIYSLGIVLFEMVAGRIPFEGDTSLTIALKHKTEEPPSPQDFNAQIPEHLNRVILKCLEKDREKRYRAADDLASDLSSLEAEISTEEKIPTKRKKKRMPRKRQLKTTWLVGIISVAVIAALGYILITRIQPTGEIKWKDSIAVLPIEDQSENKDQGLLCDGMTFDITGKLSGIEDLKVVPYREVGRYKDEDLSYKEIGKLLNAAKILESKLEKEDNTIKITFHLIDANEMSVIRLFEYSAEPEEILSIQNSLTTDVAKTIKLPLIAEKFEEDKKKDPKNAKAYGYFLSGKDFENRYGQSYEENDFTSAKKMYEEAIRTDSDYATAYFRLGILHEIKFNRDSNQEDLSLMHEYLKKAHDINPNLAESHVGLGWANFYLDDYDRAFDYFKSGLEIDPYSLDINYLTGAFFFSIGLYNQAIKFCSKAVELDPLYFWNHYLLAICFMYSGDYDKARNYFQSAMDIEPNHIDVLSHYAIFAIFQNNFEEAEIILEKVEKIGGDNVRVRHARALLLAIKDEKEEALQLIRERPYSYCATSIYSHFGMNDEAVENIRMGIEEGSKESNVYLYSYPFLINNPFYDNLRDDSSFQEIVKKEKGKYEERRKKYGKL